MLLNALRDNVDKYEKKFGEIKLQGDILGTAPLGFQAPPKDEKFH